MDDLKKQLLEERLASYVRLKGGFPVPLAGATYWAVLAVAGSFLSEREWITLAVWGSGAIFWIALLFAKLLRNDFMRDKTAVSDVLLPTFIAMLLFWPIFGAAVWTAPEIASLVLAIGMSMHWPVIGWAYGKTMLYASHAVVRALVVFAIWLWLPDGRLTLLPLSVALLYVAWVIAILKDVRRYARPAPLALQAIGSRRSARVS